MSMWISGHTSLSKEKTKELIKDLYINYPEFMKYFWVSEPVECNSEIREDDAKNGVDARYSFIIERATNESPYCLRIMPKLLYEVFGPDAILVHGLDYELIRPEDAENIAINGFSPDR
jgi:hypothetical protein